MTDLVQKLVGALEHCEGVFMSHSIDHINGGKIEDDALAIIRAALSEAKAGGWVAVPVEPAPEMIDYVRWKEYGESSIRLSPVDDETVRSVWDSVLEASRLPAPPAQKEPT